MIFASPLLHAQGEDAYAKYLAWINAQTGVQTVASNAYVSAWNESQRVRKTYTREAGRYSYGSSWGAGVSAYVSSDSMLDALMAHAFLNADDEAANVGKPVLVKLNGIYIGEYNTFTGATRNGFTSYAYDDYLPCVYADSFTYFEPVLGVRRVTNPGNATYQDFAL